MFNIRMNESSPLFGSQVEGGVVPQFFLFEITYVHL